ncbi:hypothetical protein ACCO45_004135 [Purpureocillium lilacinum]|uniref:Uncharacterized protein n=1 Tax=Purpureocillium lilacinum TaxID=33203 RepID=A0ACC4E384_PURLI
MSSPRRRIETDVSARAVDAMCGIARRCWDLVLTLDALGHENVCISDVAARTLNRTDTRRLMSDYEVTLVNDNSAPPLPC